jgi:transposase
MSYRDVQKFYITKTLFNIPKVKIGRKSLAKASLILFLTCLIIFFIVKYKFS